MITWEQDRQEQRDEWAKMTMAERLASSGQYRDLSDVEELQHLRSNIED